MPTESPWKYVTEADRALIQLLKRHVPIFADPPPGRLYHYTSGDNFIRIIESKTLWTTHISCLNDSKELFYAFDVFKKRIQARKTSERGQKIEGLLQGFYDVLPIVEMVAAERRIFVACFPVMRMT
jgi:hypothetical protein